jgi:hypothetical protein
MDRGRLSGITLHVPAGAEAKLAELWGRGRAGTSTEHPDGTETRTTWWLDPTTRWSATYDPRSVDDAATLSFHNTVADPQLSAKADAVVDLALRKLVDPALPVPDALLSLGSQSNPMRLRLDAAGQVVVELPVVSDARALSSYFAVLARRWGEPASALFTGAWSYRGSDLDVNASLTDLGDLELDLRSKPEARSPKP